MNRPIRCAAGLLLCGLLALTLAACGGGSGGTQPATGGTFKLLITDAPFPGDLVEAATVTIRQVQVRDQDGGGWRPVYDGSSTIDLVPLTGGVTSLLTEVELAPGTYDEVRLVVEAGEVTLKPEAFVNGGSHVFNVENGGLHFPSGAQTGIKVKLDTPIEVVTELSSAVTLDFDLAKNFVLNGSPERAPGVRRIIFTPVVRAVNSTTAGSVRAVFVSDNLTPGDGADDQPLAGANVTAFDDTGAEAGSAVLDDTGSIEMQLPPGVYTLQVEAARHETTTSDPVEVFLGNVSDAGTVVAAATGGEVSGVVMSDGATDVDETDDVVVAGATVEAVLAGELAPAASTSTDANGAYRFESLPAGTYDIVVRKPGHAEGTVADVTPAFTGTAVDVLLVAQTRNLTGTVTDSDAAALEGATVVVTNAAGVEIGSATTAADGTYALSVPSGAQQVVVADPTSGASDTQALDVEGADPETDLTHDVQLDTAGA